MQGVLIKNIENNENFISISLEMKRKPHKCPCCNEKTDRIHDYRLQKIKDIHAFGKQVYINLRKRRVLCEANTTLQRKQDEVAFTAVNA